MTKVGYADCGSAFEAVYHPLAHFLFEVPYPRICKACVWEEAEATERGSASRASAVRKNMERETGLEPVTFCLGSRYSTN